MSTIEMLVTRAYAASESYAGAACVFGAVCDVNFRTNPLRTYHKRQGLYWKTKSLIEFDRAITNDPRGFMKSLPPIC